MSTLSGTSANALRKRAIDAVAHNTKSVLLLSEVLWETYQHDVKVGGIPMPLYAAWEYEDWFQYVETELGIHQSTAAGFRRMHEIYNIELKDSWDSDLMEALSATKLKALCKIVTRTNINTWLRKAAKLSCCSLDEAITQSLHGGDKPGAIHTLAILCTKAEQKRMRRVIDQAMLDMGLERPGKALVQILEEWEVIHKRAKRSRAAVA